jgi:hypothetical protein
MKKGTFHILFLFPIELYYRNHNNMSEALIMNFVIKFQWLSHMLSLHWPIGFREEYFQMIFYLEKINLIFIFLSKKNNKIQNADMKPVTCHTAHSNLTTFQI